MVTYKDFYGNGQIKIRIIKSCNQFVVVPFFRELGQNVNTSELKRLIQTENGIVSISDILFFNQVGGQYSSSQTSMPYSDPVTRQIRPTADTLFATPTQIYQIRYPNKDINIRVLNLTSVNFS